MKHRSIKALPEYLQPKILSAVAFINLASPDLNKAVERINRLHSHLSEKETKNKGKADQYKHSLEMLNEEKSVSHFIVSVPHE